MDDATPRLADTFWAGEATDLATSLDSSLDGLSAEEANRRRPRLRRATHRRRTQLVLLLRQFATPITLILVLATLLSAALGETVDAVIILTIVLASGLLSFWQEYNASRAMEDLLASVEVKVRVRRNGRTMPIPGSDVVAGDVVVLDTGDLIPGDCRLLEARELLIDEAPLTGESYPAEKSPSVLPISTSVGARTNCLFRGTHLVRGSAVALVAHVGPETEFGRIAAHLEQRVPPTGFERGVTAFGLLLLRVMVVLVGLIFVVNLLLGRPFFETLLFSVALAVGLTPQLLPAIVSISLSVGARQMAREKVIVKRLSAIEDFGGMDVLCTDKTGTLTAGTVRLAGALSVDATESDVALRWAYLNAYHHTGYPNPIDDAILATRPIDVSSTRRLGEIPYDFTRRRMSVLVDDGGTYLATKGAFENVLAVCDSSLRTDSTVVSIAEDREKIRARFRELSADGLRVLAVATKRTDANAVLSTADESQMTFLGFLTFFDPPKTDANRALEELAGLGISLRMITGDNPLVAAHVAKAVGLRHEPILRGAELEQLSDDQIADSLARVDVFAEINPVQKERIVRAFRHRGHTVGFLGDGINDAPPLHAADVGISVDTATSVAKESAAIVLLEKDLEVLISGIKLGRQTFANTCKYIFVNTSASFGNMASMAAATLFLPYLPLLAFQVLLLNFLSDFPAMTIAMDNVDEEQTRRPGVWDMRFIRDFMIVFGLISSAFDFVTFGVLRLGFGASADLFRSAWFLESVATELAVMLVLRTRRPCWKSRPGLLLFVSSVAMAAVSLALVLSPEGHPLGFARPSMTVLGALVAITVGYVVATEVAKPLFYRRVLG
jgi:Mg2+-importing ATPase